MEFDFELITSILITSISISEFRSNCTSRLSALPNDDSRGRTAGCSLVPMPRAVYTVYIYTVYVL